jgi:hypothetical protein
VHVFCTLVASAGRVAPYTDLSHHLTDLVQDAMGFIRSLSKSSLLGKVLTKFSLVISVWEIALQQLEEINSLLMEGSEAFRLFRPDSVMLPAQHRATLMFH